MVWQGGFAANVARWTAAGVTRWSVSKGIPTLRVLKLGYRISAWILNIGYYIQEASGDLILFLGRLQVK